MTAAYYLVDPLPAGDVIVLDGDEGRHAATVKRAHVGEELMIGDGRGSTLGGPVCGVGRDRLEIAVQWRHFTPAPDPRLVVVQGLPKGDRAELAVELLTELGADEIVPWSAANAVARWDADRAAKGLARWRRTAREASKQSHRPWVPTVAALASTADVCARLASANAAMVLHENSKEGFGARPLPTAGDVVLVVGPEGGISDEELDQFDATGAVVVQMGAEILRTSTAGAAAIAALSLLLGRWE